MIKCASIFSNDMVLQRNKSIQIWGMAYCNDVVRVIINEISIETKTAKDNTWSISLPPMKASDSLTMTVHNVTTDERIIFSNVAVGEVWLAGGQSNMEFELQNSTNGQQELQECHNYKVRCYNVKRNAFIDEFFYLDERCNSWQVANSESCKRWTAVGYHFAKKLSLELGVTVGIVNCNWGGTSGSAWVSRERLLSHEDTKSYIQEYDKAIENKSFEEYCQELEEYQDYVAQWQPKINEFYSKNPDGLWGDALAFAGECKYPGPIGYKSEFRPCGVHETMIKRVAPYTIAGFIYYQGESDDHKPNSYYTLLQMVISQWREDWLDDTLPFMIVQLPMHIERGAEDSKNWCVIRDAQMKVHNTIKNTGIAVTLELGEYGNIHPLNKKPVGQRLALQALYHVYHKIDENSAYGATYKSHIVTGNGILVEFNHVCDGFNITGELANFEIASKDGKYYPAEVKVFDNKIFLHSSKVKYPVHARYLWTNYSDVNIYTKGNHIPLAPFNF